MSIRIRSFGGPIIWMLRKHHSEFTSKVMLSYTAKQYNTLIGKYIAYFKSQETPPVFANCMVETMNRCNGTCEFCPANIHDEVRPFKKMPQELFENIIQQLKEHQWHGKLWLSINNEPFMDTRILEFANYAKEQLGEVEIALFSNGSLLTPEKMDEMVGKIDEITINDYSEKYALSERHKAIYDHVKKHPDRFKDMRITINRRYKKEILATRAGSAPNKPTKNNNVDTPCIYPFLDFLIFPDGKVGMCCNDCKEISNFGDVTQESIFDIWKNTKYQALRQAMIRGHRSFYAFCKECDVVDAGGREQQIKAYMEQGILS